MAKQLGLNARQRRHNAHEKDIWDIIAAITPFFLGVIVSGGVGIFGYLHNVRQDKLAEITALEKLQPKLNSQDFGDREFAYLAFAQMGYGDFALRLIGLRNDNAAIPVVNSIKTMNTGLVNQADATLRQLCPEGIGDIGECPDEGCGSGEFDPELNRRKNIRSDNRNSVLRKFQWLANLRGPHNITKENSDRTQLTLLGEGQKITVVAYALVARKGGKESCNCGLAAPKDTDNQIVLVDPALKDQSLEKNEEDSETAEFTPRVRLDHPNLAREKLQPLIAAQGGRLLVRVTGVLMFDPEHLLGRQTSK